MRYTIERTNAVGLTPEASNRLDLMSEVSGLSKQAIVSALVNTSFDTALRRGLVVSAIPAASEAVDAL